MVPTEAMRLFVKILEVWKCLAYNALVTNSEKHNVVDLIRYSYALFY